MEHTSEPKDSWYFVFILYVRTSGGVELQCQKSTCNSNGWCFVFTFSDACFGPFSATNFCISFCKMIVWVYLQHQKMYAQLICCKSIIQEKLLMLYKILSFQPTNKSMHSNHLDTCSQHWNKMTLIVNLETFWVESPVHNVLNYLVSL